jgi:hypothetical protein
VLAAFFIFFLVLTSLLGKILFAINDSSKEFVGKLRFGQLAK